VAAANGQLLAAGSPFRCRLTIAGAFARQDEEEEFQRRIALSDLAGTVQYAGFVEGEAKNALLRDSDCLCFPTFYHAESFGLVVVEAMAAGLNVLTTRWRALPDLLPAEYAGFVPIAEPIVLAHALIAAFQWEATGLRAAFLAQFTEAAHATRLKRVLRSLVEKDRAA
jgi:glycosyltransferase involved in cell wall biosynthesis